MERENYLGAEHRQYTRLDSVLPVQFKLVSLDGKNSLSDWTQGFTSDISKGGICLSVNKFSSDLAALLSSKSAKMSLEITIPLKGRPVNALARVAWFKQTSPGNYLIGLSYENIDPADDRRIMRYALTKKLLAPVSLGIIVLLGLGLLVNTLINVKLTQGNKALVSQLVRVMEESAAVKQEVQEIAKERETLQAKIKNLAQNIQKVEEERKRAEAGSIQELGALTEQLAKEKKALEEQLSILKVKETTVSEQLQSIGLRRVTLEKANFDKMYQWVKAHQNLRTGLVMSFEGDIDIADWAFIYDQSLAAQVYSYFGDFERARKIFDFFSRSAKRQGKLFYNAYYASDGSPAEYTVHSGPNIWLGIAIAQYTKKSQDNTYMPLAEEIGQAIMDLQAEDNDSGIRGGPSVQWFSTEHNLDAYAFLNMLYKITGKLNYQESATKVLSWLVQNTYNKSDIPISRGKGDATIATDTYAWAIAAVGPTKLNEVGMNPDRILEFADKNCSVTVSYVRPEGNAVNVKGCDFAAQKHLARGGVVSTEWTAQMVISYKIMSQFYEKKGMPAISGAYTSKANEFLSELMKMIISSPSPSGQGESCLPYATQDFVDTGHGWLTPKGKSTGSVAGTTYTIFAYYDYNPLELKD